MVCHRKNSTKNYILLNLKYFKGHAEIVDLLIKNGAKINDSIGPITPLHDVNLMF